jgi:hypothetical protein
MKFVKKLMIFVFASVFLVNCKSVSPSIEVPSKSQSIIGSWVGCDGRVVTFKENDGKYIGRYTALGNLETYKFTKDEIGYEVIRQSLGNYSGKVKWKDTSGNESWKTVNITIENNVYSDSGSDRCSKEMKRVKTTS